METKALIFRTWDDLVFAYRNKEYGAYSIRRAYARRVVLGWGISVAIVTLLLFLPGIVSRFQKKAEVPFAGPKLDGLKVSEYIPPVRERKPPKAQPQATQSTRTDTQVLIVDNTVEVPEPTESVSSTPVTELPGEGGDEGPISEGTGTQIATIPVIVENQLMMNPEVPPSYEGGNEELIKFIQKKLRYPATPRRLGIEGTVFVSFVVNGDGSVSNVTVLRGIHMACDEEARRVISMLPGWKGARQNKIPVAVRMVLPIKFFIREN